jgi:broad specificity phosphatase PhoE
LREHDSGAWEGRSDEEVWEQMNQLFQGWIGGEMDARPQGGESLRDMQRRFTSFLETIFNQHSGTSSPILIVSHAGLYWANLPFLFKNIEFDFMREHGLDNACLIIGEYAGGEWRCISWCGEPLD